ncbi:MAG: hypothetical protein HFG51_06780 [Lachnospiraceae bacterium]|nr:hypothetical protein [Lachnospiraceae bacterium]
MVFSLIIAKEAGWVNPVLFGLNAQKDSKTKRSRKIVIKKKKNFCCNCGKTLLKFPIYSSIAIGCHRLGEADGRLKDKHKE